MHGLFKTKENKFHHKQIATIVEFLQYYTLTVCPKTFLFTLAKMILMTFASKYAIPFVAGGFGTMINMCKPSSKRSK